MRNSKYAKKLHAHADNFNITNTCEINADNNSVVYFNELFKIIRDTTSREKHYYYFLYNICIDLEYIQQSRENLYKMCLKQDYALKKALIKKFNIDKEALLIP